MKTFVTKTYGVGTGKLQGHSLTLAVLSDLHGSLFGENNRDLKKAILRARPDVVLLAGDLFNRDGLESRENAEYFLCDLADHLPVYYVLGNHEYSLRMREREVYEEYEAKLKAHGVKFLHNCSCLITCKGTKVRIHGLELPLLYYKKPWSPALPEGYIESCIGKPDPEALNILICHTPKYAKAYFSWGADMILSGHYHGGMVRLSENRGLISPQFQIFPPYCCGRFLGEQAAMFVSAGLGEHTVPVRIHNPRELLVLRCD
jgi:predicted MPP superfamily phosphohydrolase